MDTQIRVFVVAAPGSLRDSLCAVLQTGGQVVVADQADDADSGLRKMANYAATVMLLDADLLDDEAWRTLAEIKRRWPQVRCLVWAHTFSQARRAASAGVDGVLDAQFSAEGLLQAMARVAGEKAPHAEGRPWLPL